MVRPPCYAKSHHTQQYRLGGFYTGEIRQAGQRKGFPLVTFRGKEGTIAHVKFAHRCRVSKYGVDIATIDRFAEMELALTDAVDVYLLDEIGKMECFSSTFVDKIEVLLNPINLSSRRRQLRVVG